jgi:hypothetical protein
MRRRGSDLGMVRGGVGEDCENCEDIIFYHHNTYLNVIWEKLDVGQSQDEKEEE